MPITGIAGAGGVARPFGGEPPKRLAVEVSSANPSRQDVARAVFQQFGFTEKDADYLARNFNGRDPVAAFADSLEIDPRSISSADGKTRVTVELSGRDFATLQKLAAGRPSATSAQTAPTNSSEAAQARRGYDHGANLRERLNRQMDAAAPKPKPPETPAPSQEGVGSFLEGAVAGDFSDNDSWSATAGKIVGGLNPLADVRDIAAGVKHVAEGKDGAWVDLGTATLGAIPLVGDAGKALIRGGRKVAKEAVEEGAEALAKEAAEKTARELATKQKALQLEQLDGGHSVARHGPEVSDADLQRRLTTGVAPDGKFSPTPASTRFNSYQDWVQTREAAQKGIEYKFGVDLKKPPAIGADDEYEIIVEYNRAIDDGFVANLASKAKVADPKNAKRTGNGYSTYNPVDGITRTYTKAKWDGQAWKIVQHYPSAKGWDNATKTYAPSAEVDLGVKLP
jgi:hypothetical protein